MPNTKYGIDSFTIPGYDVPDAMPSEIASDNSTKSTEQSIPLVVWMFVFLLIGYLGLRMVLED